MRTVKVLAGLAGGIILLIVVGLLAVWALVNPNDYKGRIAAAVKESTGRELILKGDIKLSVFPWVALELGPASLGNPPGFGAEPFLAFNHAAVRISLWRLLSKRMDDPTRGDRRLGPHVAQGRQRHRQLGELRAKAAAYRRPNGADRGRWTGAGTCGDSRHQWTGELPRYGDRKAGFRDRRLRWTRSHSGAHRLRRQPRRAGGEPDLECQIQLQRGRAI